MRMRLTLVLPFILPVLVPVLVLANEATQAKRSVAWRLASHCPPGFTLDERQRCRLDSLYTRYGSLQNAGVGGLRTGLPPVRDGFSPEQIDLGRLLFFDPILSGNGKIACASCHQPALGFADGRGRSEGIDRQLAKRSAPSLWNMALTQRFFWDGRARGLETQVQGPLYSAIEMGSDPQRLLARLRANPPYVALFAQAFGGEPLTLDQLYTALAAFECSLISLNSRYDLYAHGFHDALSGEEIEGLNVFRSFVARCAECHTPPLFSNQQIAVIGTPDPNGLAFDIGAEGVSGDASQRGGFKVPSLRNIALTKPYMHSGRFETLREAVAFYNGGRGHAVPAGQDLNLHWHIWEPNMTEQEVERLVDFLQALTDQRFMPRIPTVLPSGLEPIQLKIDRSLEE